MSRASSLGRRLPRSTCRTPQGQTLVEFALVLTVFLLLTLGLLDGLRVIFYYSQVQEAAREGARWASVQVGRTLGRASTQTPWGTFADPGNAPGTYCDGASCTPVSPFPSTTSLLATRTITGTSAVTTTVVGAATQALTAVSLRQATVAISTTIPATATEALQTNDLLTNVPITVSVAYPFQPVLGLVFGGVTITVKGSSTMLHA